MTQCLAGTEWMETDIVKGDFQPVSHMMKPNLGTEWEKKRSDAMGHSGVKDITDTELLISNLVSKRRELERKPAESPVVSAPKYITLPGKIDDEKSREEDICNILSKMPVLVVQIALKDDSGIVICRVP